MNWDELKALETSQLEDKIKEWSLERFKLKVKARKEKKVEKPHMFPLLRKQVARAKTLIQQRRQMSHNS